jgi:hypothetical protein
MVCMSDRIIGGSTSLVMSDSLSAGCGENGRDIASEHDMTSAGTRIASGCTLAVPVTKPCLQQTTSVTDPSKKIVGIYTQLVDFYRIPIVSVDIHRLEAENLL